MNKQKGFTLKELIIILCIIAALGILLAPSAQAGNLSVAGGMDTRHDTSQEYFEVRWRDVLLTDGAFVEGVYADSFGYSLYAGSMDTLGGDLYLTWDSFMFGFGIEYAEPGDDVVETEGGYQLLFEYAFTEQVALSLKHRSNCRYMCKGPLEWLPHGSDEKSNKGYNFLTLRYIF